MGKQVYRAYRSLLDSERVRRIEALGGRMQRLLWASTSTKDPLAPDTMYVSGLAAPLTVNTMPDATLLAFFDHGRLEGLLPDDGGDCDAMLERFAAAGIDVKALAQRLQADGAKAFVDSWTQLLGVISAQSARVST